MILVEKRQNVLYTLDMIVVEGRSPYQKQKNIQGHFIKQSSLQRLVFLKACKRQGPRPLVMSRPGKKWPFRRPVRINRQNTEKQYGGQIHE